MFMKTLGHAAIFATLIAAASASHAQNIGDPVPTNNMGSNAPSLGGGSSLGDPVFNGNIGSQNPSTNPQLPPGLIDVGINSEAAIRHGNRMVACDQAGGHYIVGPVCFDREGNAINM